MARFPDITISRFRARTSPRGDLSREEPGPMHDEVKRRVIYTATKKYDNRQRRGRFGLIGDCLSTLVTRYLGAGETTFIHVALSKARVVIGFTSIVPVRFCLVAVARAVIGFIDCLVILINVTVAAVINYRRA